MVVKQFNCPVCGAEGKISIKGDSFGYEDISTCPVCGVSLVEEEDDLERDYQD